MELRHSRATVTVRTLTWQHYFRSRVRSRGRVKPTPYLLILRASSGRFFYTRLSPIGSPLQIFFDSLTGNTRRFSYRLSEAVGTLPFDIKTHLPEKPFLLITYTFGRGEVPLSTARFLEDHASKLCGVVSSGSFHWGENFARAGEHIAAHYDVPLVAKINKSGSVKDMRTVANWLELNCE